MGTSGSSFFNKCRRIVMRYNVENRAHKFLQKGKFPPAPRHPTYEDKLKDFTLSEKELQELHGKNEQLSEFLKKVYLTSTSTITGTPSKRPKPKKENEVLKKFIFFEPEETSPGHCTLTSVVKILLKHQENSESWSVSEIARNYQLEKKDVVKLLMYYSLFKVERFEFLEAKPLETTEESESERIQFEIYDRLEKKPLRQIEGKK